MLQNCQEERGVDHGKSVPAGGKDAVQLDRGGKAVPARGEAAQRGGAVRPAGGQPRHPAGGPAGPAGPGGFVFFNNTRAPLLRVSSL